MRAGAISDSELQFLYGRATFRNPAGDLLAGCRTNLVVSKMRRLAGSTSSSTYVHDSGDHLWENSSHRWTRQPRRLSGFGHDSYFDESWQRHDPCLCFSIWAARSRPVKLVLLTGPEAWELISLVVMQIWCYIVPQDAIKNPWISEGAFIEAPSTISRKESPKCFQMRHPRVQHASSNSLCLLKQYEDQLGCPCRECTQPD